MSKKNKSNLSSFSIIDKYAYWFN